MRSAEDFEQVADEELRDLQLVELSILREFVRVCEANGLRYYLAYGTLLGAVRHQGFIPWDDDIDVTMPRGDYNRFAEISGASLRPGFVWQSYTTNRHYPHVSGRLLRKDTVLRHARSEHLAFEQAVCIDVFPLDGSANDPWEVLAQRTVIRICRMRLSFGIKRKPLKRLLAQMTRIIPRSVAIAAFEAITRRVSTDKAATWICAGGPYSYRRQSFPSHWFGSGVTQTFEGMSLVGPVSWDRYLTQLYGDYMVPPEMTDRLSHHEVTEVALDALHRGSNRRDGHKTNDDRRRGGRPFGR